MSSRILLFLLGGFWLFMTPLLWRSEYVDSALTGFPVDPQLVWSRILTSPDSSSLAVLYDGKRVGFCHLITSVAESLDQGTRTNAPVGMVRDIHQYKLDLSGSVDELGDGRRLRFDGELILSEDRLWEQFRLQLIVRPLFITVESQDRDGLLHLRVDGPDLSLHRTLRLSELNDPQALLSELWGPMVSPTLNALPLPQPGHVLPVTPSQLRWEASTDRLSLGSAVTHVYRLHLQLMEGYAVELTVSRAGEILRVRLPQNLVLVNEALTGL